MRVDIAMIKAIIETIKEKVAILARYGINATRNTPLFALPEVYKRNGHHDEGLRKRLSRFLNQIEKSGRKIDVDELIVLNQRLLHLLELLQISLEFDIITECAVISLGNKDVYLSKSDPIPGAIPKRNVNAKGVSAKLVLQNAVEIPILWALVLLKRSGGDVDQILDMIFELINAANVGNLEKIREIIQNLWNELVMFLMEGISKIPKIFSLDLHD